MFGISQNRRFKSSNRNSAPAIIAVIGLGLAGSVYAYKSAVAAMAVTDAGAIAKLASQLGELKKQVESLTDIASTAEGMLDTIGAKGEVSFGNLSAVQRQVRQWSGVLNDPSKLKVNFNLPKGVNLPDFSDVQRTGDFYKDVLTYNPPEKPEEVDGVLQPATITKQESDIIDYRRFRKTEDAALSGIAVSDTAIADFSRVMSEVVQLQNEADSAIDDVARQSVIMNLLVKLNQQHATTNLLEASKLAVISGSTLRAMPTYIHAGRYQESAAQ